MDAEKIRNLAESLLNGTDVITEIISEHIDYVRRIAGSIARRYPNKASDIESVAYLALTKAVNKAAPPPLGEGRLKDSGITKFIVKWVKGSIWEFLRKDHLVVSTNGESVDVTRDSQIQMDEEESLELFETIPDEKEEQRRKNSERLDQILEVIEGPLEGRILTMRLDGYTMREIAEKQRVSKSTVENTINELRVKVNKFISYEQVVSR